MMTTFIVNNFGFITVIKHIHTYFLNFRLILHYINFLVKDTIMLKDKYTTIPRIITKADISTPPELSSMS